MSFSIIFLINIVGVLLFLFLRKSNTRLSSSDQAMLIVNIVVISFFVGLYTLAFFILMAWLLYKYSEWWEKDDGQQKKKIKVGAVFFATLIACFILFNRTRVLNIASDIQVLLATLGSSYFLFKSLSYLLDTIQGKIKNNSFLTLVNYLLFFPTFVNGPMYRYNEFEKQIKSKLMAKKARALYKVSLGIFKVVLISPLLYPYINYINIHVSNDIMVNFALSLLGYYVYLYANFSGFCDIGIGVGAYFGFKVPENFRDPFIATNLADFWRRWHITLSRVLFDSIYSPLRNLFTEVLQNKWGIKCSKGMSSFFVSSSCYLITFLISGLWHGSHKHFLVWGLWHGLGLSIRRAYRILVNTEVFESHQNALVRRTYTISAWAITFLFVTTGWSFFIYRLDTIRSLFG